MSNSNTIGTKIDLHTHTTASDGTLTPTELVNKAAELGIGILAVADHDTLAGMPEAAAAAKAAGIKYVNAIEFGIDIDGVEVHMLGYFFDPEHPPFREKVDELHDYRFNRGKIIVKKLNALGVNVSWERVEEIANGASVGRPHVAQALVEGGFVPSIDQAFELYLAHGKPAYVEHMKLSPGECISMVHDAGGIAVLAHPTWLDDAEALLPSLVAAGLDGIEVYYGRYDDDTIHWLEGLAAKYKLVMSGGSDYHGRDSLKHGILGGVSVPQDVFATLEEYAAQRQQTAAQ